MTNLKPINKELLSAQFGVFFGETVARPDVISDRIKRDYPDIFNGAPINLPIPVEILDFPISQLKSIDNKWQLNVSRLRADIVFNPEENQTYADIVDAVKKIYEMVGKIAEEAKKTGVVISRITNISNYIFFVDNPIVFLQTLFLKQNNSKMSDLVIRYNELLTEKNLNFNNITQYQIGNVKKDEKEISVLLVMKDFNTNPEIKNKLSDQEISDFLSVAQKHTHNFELPDNV